MGRITKHSKTSYDIAQENSVRTTSSLELAKKQKRITEQFSKFPFRKQCVCCGKKLLGAEFSHRGLRFIECENCNHIQSKNLPTPNYPEDISQKSGFDSIYTDLSSREYASRTDRIYRPKLEWIFETLIELGHSKEELINKKWIELGSGAGNFLSTCKNSEITDVTGIEVNENLVSISRKHNPQLKTIQWSSSFEAILKEHDADIFCSFFVLEHIHDLSPVWKEFSRKPRGTIFAFSVPVFGLSGIAENIFPEHFARNLDGVVHTQVFTDTSIEYAMQEANYQILGEWIFGQDTSDLIRFLQNCSKSSPSTKTEKKLFQQLSKAHDTIQSAFDQNHLSDQRHILAIRT